MLHTHAQVKVIGANGQIYLGKRLAGKMVLIEQVTEDTWILKPGTFVPDSEQWIHQPPHQEKLDRAIAWAANNQPQDNFEAFISGG